MAAVTPPRPPQPTLRPRLARALLRLFAVQGSYNYERLLGVGVGVAEEPLLRDLGDGKYRPAVARGAHFFNAHPYLIGLAVGAAARAEHEGASPDQIERLREALCGPLGSLGDRLVWAGWLPFLSGLALAGVALGAGWTAVGMFLLVYNIGHVGLRWWALKAGWTYGRRVSVALHHPALQKAGALLGPAMAFAVGAALPLTAAYLSGPFDSWARVALAVVAALGFLALRLRGDRLNGLRLSLGLAAVALVVGVIWQ
jgi:PTS system mannose-specific IID component